MSVVGIGEMLMSWTVSLVFPPERLKIKRFYLRAFVALCETQLFRKPSKLAWQFYVMAIVIKKI